MLNEFSILEILHDISGYNAIFNAKCGPNAKLPDGLVLETKKIHVRIHVSL